MSKKLLKNLEGAVIEKVTADAAKRKVKIKTDKGTITLEFKEVAVSTDTIYGTDPVVDIDFKEPKAPNVVPERPKLPGVVRAQPAITEWPFPTGNKP